MQPACEWLGCARFLQGQRQNCPPRQDGAPAACQGPWGAPGAPRTRGQSPETCASCWGGVGVAGGRQETRSGCRGPSGCSRSPPARAGEARRAGPTSWGECRLPSVSTPILGGVCIGNQNPPQSEPPGPRGSGLGEGQRPAAQGTPRCQTPSGAQEGALTLTPGQQGDKDVGWP